MRTILKMTSKVIMNKKTSTQTARRTRNPQAELKTTRPSQTKKTSQQAKSKIKNDLREENTQMRVMTKRLEVEWSKQTRLFTFRLTQCKYFQAKYFSTTIHWIDNRVELKTYSKRSSWTRRALISWT